MRSDSSLSESQRAAAVELFERGHSRTFVARRLGGSRDAVRALHDRWRLRGAEVLMTKTTRRMYTFEEKHALVQQVLAGETKVAVAQAAGLSSPNLLAKWVRAFVRQGEAGLRPRPLGRPWADQRPEAEPELSELERLRRENERLRAEVAYLGKVRALSGQARG
jgi:transposase-like protein